MRAGVHDRASLETRSLVTDGFRRRPLVGHQRVFAGFSAPSEQKFSKKVRPRVFVEASAFLARRNEPSRAILRGETVFPTGSSPRRSAPGSVHPGRSGSESRDLGPTSFAEC